VARAIMEGIEPLAKNLTYSCSAVLRALKQGFGR